MVHRLDLTQFGPGVVAVSRSMRDDPSVPSDPIGGVWRLAEERGW